MSAKASVPLIKEHRITKIIEALECIDRYAFNREKQRACILELYPDKTEKSVFRGMVIPSLRDLGLIIGYADAIRISSNGKLILEGQKNGEMLRIARAIFLELDRQKFHFIDVLEEQPEIDGWKFLKLISQTIQAASEKQIRERISRWLGILISIKIISSDNAIIRLEQENYKKAEKDLMENDKRTLFKDIMFVEYKLLSSLSTIGIIDIADLRQNVSLTIYKNHNQVLTESQFDNLLRDLPLVHNDYIISLGQTMGAEEKLFFYKGNYYRTLGVTFFK